MKLKIDALLVPFDLHASGPGGDHLWDGRTRSHHVVQN